MPLGVNKNMPATSAGKLRQKAGGRQRRPVGLVGVLRGHLMACMARPCYAVGSLQKHACDVCGETEAKAGRRQGRPVGLVGVLHRHSMACMACPCYAVGSLQKHSNVIGRGMTSPPLDCTHARQLRAWHDITALGQHTRSATSGIARHQLPWTAHTVSNDGRRMTSPPLDSTHGWQRRAWHDITALGQHTQSATSAVA